MSTVSSSAIKTSGSFNRQFTDDTMTITTFQALLNENFILAAAPSRRFTRGTLFGHREFLKAKDGLSGGDDLDKILDKFGGEETVRNTPQNPPREN